MDEEQELTQEQKDTLLSFLIDSYLADRGRRKYALSILIKDLVHTGKARVVNGIIFLSK
jgi:hypothetical protein